MVTLDGWIEQQRKWTLPDPTPISTISACAPWLAQALQWATPFVTDDTSRSYSHHY